MVAILEVGVETFLREEIKSPEATFKICSKPVRALGIGNPHATWKGLVQAFLGHAANTKGLSAKTVSLRECFSFKTHHIDICMTMFP